MQEGINIPMSQKKVYLTLPDAPAIPGLAFRFFQGETDLPAIEAVRNAVRAVDGDLWLPGPDGANSTCDPEQDCLLAEVEGQVIGYTWLIWWSENAVELFLHLGWLVPEWRRRGIGRVLLRWQEQRLRQIAQKQLATKPCVFGGNADETQPGNRALLLSEGYTVAFTFMWMTCQLPTEPIQPAPLPAGLEIRPVERTHLPALYAANEEAFSESRGGHILESYETWLHDLGWPNLDTGLWVVAWDGDQIAGHVISTSDEEGAHTPWVATRRPWRRRGLGKALMTRMLQRCQQRGIQQADIGTVAENPGKSAQLYESVGYQIVLRQPRYRKPMSASDLKAQR